MRDAKTCAQLDPRSNPDEMAAEVRRTQALLEFGRENGAADAIEAVEREWVETDGYGDKACAFQLTADINETPPSLEAYRKANDALEAAIAAETD